MTNIHGAQRVFGNLQDGEFSVPYGFLNAIVTHELQEHNHITGSEFIQIQKLTPDDNNQLLKIEANIYRYMDN